MWNIYILRLSGNDPCFLCRTGLRPTLQHIEREEIPIVPLYFAKERPAVERDGMLIFKDYDRMVLRPGEQVEGRMIRFRTLGCYPLTGAIDSTPPISMQSSRKRWSAATSERQGRVIDRDEAGFMEKKKREGVLSTMRHLPSDALVGVAVEHEFADAIQPRKSLLRFLTCGSVDDGKSTLIGRLLSDTRQNSRTSSLLWSATRSAHGTTGDNVDFALLVDGLEAEREQGITIDVAYRFFDAAPQVHRRRHARPRAIHAKHGNRRFTADLAIVLIDARQGVLRQTRRHLIIASLSAPPYRRPAINKIDLVGFDATVFERIVAEYAAFAATLGFASITSIPISARFGDNVTERWKTRRGCGSTLLEHLETIDVDGAVDDRPFCFPAHVNRPNLYFRGFSGTIASGAVAEGR